MPNTILLTSFAPWKPHHRSNSSDDLLLELLKQPLPGSWHIFRQLPVNLPIAEGLAIAKFQQLQPDLLICCGMAESRRRLSVESQAIVHNQTLHTRLDLDALTQELTITEISHDAGRFVCNSLYYFMLKYLSQHYPDRHCLFIHVPVLTPENHVAILADFCKILERVA